MTFYSIHWIPSFVSEFYELDHVIARSKIDVSGDAMNLPFCVLFGSPYLHSYLHSIRIRQGYLLLTLFAIYQRLGFLLSICRLHLRSIKHDQWFNQMENAIIFKQITRCYLTYSCQLRVASNYAYPSISSGGQNCLQFLLI